MSRFIKTTSGYLNQDHILLIRFGTAKTAEEGLDLIQMSDGRIVQTQIQDFEWLDPEVRLKAEALHHPPEAAADEPATPEAPATEPPEPEAEPRGFRD